MKKARKITVGFLAVYLLALLFVPCTDNCATKEHPAPTTFEAAQQHHEQNNDICSPFCLCSCCSTLITVVHFTELKTFVPTETKAFSIYNQSFFSTLSFSIWQPPKFS